MHCYIKFSQMLIIVVLSLGRDFARQSECLVAGNTKNGIANPSSELGGAPLHGLPLAHPHYLGKRPLVINVSTDGTAGLRVPVPSPVQTIQVESGDGLLPGVQHGVSASSHLVKSVMAGRKYARVSVQDSCPHRRKGVVIGDGRSCSLPQLV